MTTTDDMDDTARLILMDIREQRAGLNALDRERTTALREFMPRMREAFPGLTSRDSFETLIPLYKKYMGFDGRVLPTHDLDTGEPLRGGRR